MEWILNKDHQRRPCTKPRVFMFLFCFVRVAYLLAVLVGSFCSVIVVELICLDCFDILLLSWMPHFCVRAVFVVDCLGVLADWTYIALNVKLSFVGMRCAVICDRFCFVCLKPLFFWFTLSFGNLISSFCSSITRSWSFWFLIATRSKQALFVVFAFRLFAVNAWCCCCSLVCRSSCLWCCFAVLPTGEESFAAVRSIADYILTHWWNWVNLNDRNPTTRVH